MSRQLAGMTLQKARGTSWDTIIDEVTFHFEPVNKRSTRGILSNVSFMLDPLGLVAPLDLPAKQLLRELYKCSMG